ncbi:uncharacterized protein [Pleurodeles waltl]|uniref:uncharacterized protein n=1 Tax=Pleurodeles waltl TaxID=8319 RepID=UPI0037095B8C
MSSEACGRLLVGEAVKIGSSLCPVLCGVCDQLSEADVAHAFQKIGNVCIFEIIVVEVEVTKDDAVFGVDGEWGDGFGSGIVEAGAWSRGSTLIDSGAGESAGSLKNPFGENKEWRRKDRFIKLRGRWWLLWGTDMELSHLSDPKLCLQGSEYWCQSEETASLCMKEDYCMELWQNALAELEASPHGGPEDATEEEKRKKKKKNNKGKQDKKGKKNKKNKRKEKTAVKCSGCTQIVTNLKNYVGGKLDDDTIKGAVDSMCDKVDDSIMKICTTMKEKNKDDLVAAVKNWGSPKDVCTQIQLCEGQELEESEGPQLPAPRVGPTCIFCQAFISFVKPLLTDKLQNKATGQLLAGFCMEHFGNSTTCNGFLSTYGTVVKQVLLKPWDQVTTCREIGACEAEISMSQSGVKRAASQHKSLEDTYSTQLLMVND